jgi:hypothetical protein
MKFALIKILMKILEWIKKILIQKKKENSLPKIVFLKALWEVIKNI